ncbi:hypothetical protein [Mangrovimonas aestuarii]|uniref:hypothetical protein n=1 Tax=Mangrovimonas aestuarii TaxID=3018443 RepID=UPI002378D35F|nr:hypothetical protein [Mangrovimonas aestuarii]
MEKKLDAYGLEQIDINANAVSEISVSTADINEIAVKAYVEGEYNENIVLNVVRESEKISLNCQFQPMFTMPDDKLAAHKVTAIVMEIVLPESLSIYLISDISHVTLSGVYNSCMVELINGYLEVDDFEGELLANTIRANMLIKTKLGQIEASTKTGVVELGLLKKGSSKFVLNSIDGNITVLKIE